MANLRLQTRLSADILKCGKHKVWLDPNEISEIAMANTRVAIRKLIRDGFIIKKPQKIHTRFRARKRKIEKKKGRHLGLGSRRGSRDARNPQKKIWIKRQRCMRRLLRRYRETGFIDSKMYQRYYLRAKGNAFKNKASMVERLHHELSEKKRNRLLLEEYKVRREEALQRKLEKEKRKQKFLDQQLQLAEEAEQIRLQQEAAAKREKQAAESKAKKGKSKGKAKKSKGGDDGDVEMDDKSKGKKGKKAKGKKKEAAAEPEPDKAPKKKRRRRGKKGGD